MNNDLRVDFAVLRLVTANFAVHFVNRKCRLITRLVDFFVNAQASYGVYTFSEIRYLSETRYLFILYFVMRFYCMTFISGW